ncbi:hypothetical protein OPQ81_003307 [Rhizoctonia solani]|nr:hypothetical protein OPQ81_003307 [Rhizoctonia solani]
MSVPAKLFSMQAHQFAATSRRAGDSPRRMAAGVSEPILPCSLGLSSCTANCNGDWSAAGGNHVCMDVHGVQEFSPDGPSSRVWSCMSSSPDVPWSIGFVPSRMYTVGVFEASLGCLQGSFCPLEDSDSVEASSPKHRGQRGDGVKGVTRTSRGREVGSQVGTATPRLASRRANSLHER